MGDKTLGKAEHQGGHLKKASRTLNSTLFGQKQKPTSNLKARITNEIPPPLFLIGTCRSRKKLEPSKWEGNNYDVDETKDITLYVDHASLGNMWPILVQFTSPMIN
jgi:hypothetical protein